MPISKATIAPLPVELGGQQSPISLAIEVPEVADRDIALPKGEIIGNALLCKTDGCQDIIPFTEIADHYKVKHGFTDPAPPVPPEPPLTPEKQRMKEVAEELGKVTEETVEQEVIRDKLGHFLPGNKEGVGVANGVPCTFCKNEKAIMKQVNAYLAKFTSTAGGRADTPFIEELALLLNIDEDTVNNWATKRKKGTEQLEHSAFFGAYKRIWILQKVQLKRIGLKGRAQHFAQFLLSANHGLISSEKKVIAGAGSQEPIFFRAVDDKNFVEEEEDKYGR